jgi:hypothetical protein
MRADNNGQPVLNDSNWPGYIINMSGYDFGTDMLFLSNRSL